MRDLHRPCGSCCFCDVVCGAQRRCGRRISSERRFLVHGKASWDHAWRGAICGSAWRRKDQGSALENIAAAKDQKCENSLRNLGFCEVSAGNPAGYFLARGAGSGSCQFHHGIDWSSRCRIKNRAHSQVTDADRKPLSDDTFSSSWILRRVLNAVNNRLVRGFLVNRLRHLQMMNASLGIAACHNPPERNLRFEAGPPWVRSTHIHWCIRQQTRVRIPPAF